MILIETEEDLERVHRHFSMSADEPAVVDELSEISTIQSHDRDLQLSVFEVKSKLLEVYDLFKIKGNLKDVLYEFDVQYQDLKITSDLLKLQKLLYILLDNALKFTEKGYIILGSKVIDNYLEIYVKDTGIGISKENQSMIFESFTKIEDDISILYRGVGLGLYIAKLLASELGGELGVDSEFGKGSKFYFTVPLPLVDRPF